MAQKCKPARKKKPKRLDRSASAILSRLSIRLPLYGDSRLSPRLKNPNWNVQKISMELHHGDDNTGGLPFAHSPEGTAAAIMLAGGSSIAVYALLRVMGFVHRT